MAARRRDVIGFGALVGRAVARINGSRGNPVLEVGNDPVRKLARRGHLIAFVTQRRQQQAFAGASGLDRRAAGAAELPSLGRIEAQLALR